jgi:membrane-associated phospholipid phosphatase
VGIEKRSVNSVPFLFPLWPMTLFLLAALFVAPWDIIIVQTLDGHRIPKFLKEVIENSECFGHAVGVFYIALGIYVLDPKHRKLILPFVLSILIAGLLANVFKLIIARARPRDLELDAITVLQSFKGWWPTWQGIKVSQSFPSAHTTVAVTMACWLARIYPHGRWLFGFLAVMVAWQRIMVQAHFPSDVMAAGALGWSWSYLVFRYWPLPPGNQDSSAVTTPAYNDTDSRIHGTENIGAT